MKNLLHILSHLVFWVWNLTFIGLMYIWFLPEFGFDLLQSARNGEVDPTFTVSFIALLVVPLICTLLGGFRLRKYPILLMRLFYGVEAPLFALCLLRIFLIRELTVASGFLLGLVVVAIATFAIELLSGYSAYRPRLAKVQMVSHSVILLVGLYLGALLFLYSLPALVAVIVGFFQFGWVPDLGYFFEELMRFMVQNPLEAIKSLWYGSISLLFVFLFGFSVLVFFSMPYTLVNFYVRAWARIRTAFGKQYGDKQSWAITGVTIALSCLFFVGVQAQPQTKAFNLLETPAIEAAASIPATSAPSQVQQAQIEQNLIEYRQSQLDNASAIKAGLTNAYLYRYRYLSPWSSSNQLKYMYRNALYMKEGGAQFFQTLHNALLSPFLYRGDNDDPEKAAELYAQIFDTSIQQAERSAIRNALQATANRDETSAGLLNLDQKIVRLASQEVSVTEQGDWGTVEIHEQYENFTNEPQEIFYSFSLPESAAITWLWLGDADSPKLFQYVVSPRGAAQQVYKGEVARGQRRAPVDPALLEQVGPRQYRLRVFPIPAAENLETALGERVPGELHLWMTYQVMQQDGGWPLPQLSEKRSIFWTENTKHLRGKRQVDLSEDQWFEAAIPARKKVNAQVHTVALEEGYKVTATPMTPQEKQLPAGQRFAVVIDSSYSMGEHANALKQATESLKPVGKNNTLDFYVATAAPVTASEIDNADILQPTENVEKQSSVDINSVDINKMMFYGSLQPADMLQQFAAQRGNSSYDAVLLLTDEGSYELANDQSELPDIQAPLWIVHVDGKLPSAYKDDLLQTLQASQGGVGTDAIAALQRMTLAAKATTSLDGYTWQVTPLDNSDPSPKATPDSPDALLGIAARQLILQQGRTLDTSQVSALDEVHAIAKRTGVVTPYSSMLVLVDERQKELLKEAEASEDRFEREVEDGQDNLTQPGNPITASVPEPSQVLSLLVGAAALGLLKRKSGLTHATGSKRKRSIG